MLKMKKQKNTDFLPKHQKSKIQPSQKVKKVLNLLLLQRFQAISTNLKQKRNLKRNLKKKSSKRNLQKNLKFLLNKNFNTLSPKN